MPKFGILKYVESMDDVNVKWGIKNKRFVDWYVQKYVPYTVTEKSIIGEDGYVVYMPTTDKSDNKHYIVNETIKSLKELDVVVVDINEDNIVDEQIQINNKKYVQVLSINNIVRRIVKLNEINKKNVNIVVIDGDYDITRFVVKKLTYDNITIVTDDIEKYDDVVNSKYDEYGIAVTVVSKDDKLLKVFENSHIVIDTEYEINKYTYKLKENCCYINLNDNDSKISVIKNKRDDIVVVDSVVFKINSDRIKDYELALALYCKSKDYRVVSNGRWYDGAADALDELMREAGVKVVGFE